MSVFLLVSVCSSQNANGVDVFVYFLFEVVQLTSELKKPNPSNQPKRAKTTNKHQ